MKKLSQDTIDQIIKLYQEGCTPKAIGEQFNILNGSVIRILHKNGITPNQHKSPVSPETTQYIINKYTIEELSCFNIAQDLHLSVNTIYAILKKNNITFLNNTTIDNTNSSYFSNINTEEQAYFLGFVCGSGIIAKKGIKITFKLDKKYKDILIKLSQNIFSINKIKVKQEKLILSIYDKTIYNDIKNYNKLITETNISHFLRGYLEGNNFDIKNETITFKNINLDIQNYFEKFNIVPDIINNNELYFIGKNKHKTILNKLYENCNIYLLDNYDKYKLIQKYTQRKFEIDSDDISNYGTKYIPRFNNIKLTKENVIKLSEIEKLKVANYLTDFYLGHGFPYENMTDDAIIKEFNALKAYKKERILGENNIIKTYANSGTNIFKHFAPHFYEINTGGVKQKLNMLEAFNNRELLNKAIYLLLKNNYNINGSLIKSSIADNKIGYKASIFNCGLAKTIYELYTKDGDIVYDCSMGFGQRLLGAMATSHKLKYVGVDPLKKTVESNKNIFNFLNKNIPNFGAMKDAEIICSGCEDYCDEKYIGKIKLVFSSLPYYHLEKYENDPGQAYYNKSYVEFINKWWRGSVENIDKLLMKDGIIALNVANKVLGFEFAQDICNVLIEKGYKIIQTYKMEINKNNFNLSDDSHKYEPIFIFQKQQNDDISL